MGERGGEIEREGERGGEIERERERGKRELKTMTRSVIINRLHCMCTI